MADRPRVTAAVRLRPRASVLLAVTSLVGVGGICVWAYLKSFTTTKLIPIRDPRIGECLTHHD